MKKNLVIALRIFAGGAWCYSRGSVKSAAQPAAVLSSAGAPDAVAAGIGRL